MYNVLFAGFGDIATRVHQQFQTLLRVPDCYAIKRSKINKVEKLSLLYCDMLQQDALTEVLSKVNPDYIVVTLTPSEYTEQGYHNAYVKPLKALVGAIQTKGLTPKVFLVSSTSVYGQNNGEWVDEYSAVEPFKTTAMQLLSAEKILMPIDYCLLRCSGMYSGPSQRMTQLSQNIGEHYQRWSNRIHRDDVAGFIVHLIQQHSQGVNIDNCYVVSDNQPQILSKVLAYIANSDDTQEIKSAIGKRCNNKRMQATGYQLKYPDYQFGYNL